MSEPRYIVEVRETDGDLVSILQNAYSIGYDRQVNAPHILTFKLPADDSKLSDITLARELWLRNYEDDELIRKFRLKRDLDNRDGPKLECTIEAHDYMSQLATGKVLNYEAGWDLEYLAMSASYGGNIYAIYIDDTHVYVGGGTTETVRKYLRSDMSYVGETAGYGGTIRAIDGDDTHIYVGGQTTERVRKYLKSDLSYIGQTNSYGGSIFGLVVDDTHIYVVGSGDDDCKKYLKSDLSYVTASVAYPDTINAIAHDDTYVYIGGDYTTYAKVRKLAKTDLSSSALSPDYGDNILSIAVGSTYVYAGGDDGDVKQYLKSDMTYVAASPGYGGDVWAICLSSDGVFIYAGGETTDKIRRYDTSDMSLDDEGTDYGGAICAMALDDNHVFIGGATTQKVYKYAVADTIDDIIDELLALPMQTPVITKGTIATAYVDLIRNISVGDGSILSTLLELQGMVGGYLEVDNSRQLDWSESIGEDKGQQIRYRKNLLGIERERDYTLYNRIYAYGYNPDTGQRITLSSIQDEDYVEDTTSQTEWGGIYVGSFTNFSINSAATLLAWANQLLEDYKDPIITYSIRTIDLSAFDGFSFEELQLGSTVTVIDEDLGINVSATVVRIYHPNLAQPHNMEIELANVVKNLGDKISQMSGVQKQHGYLLGT